MVSHIVPQSLNRSRFLISAYGAYALFAALRRTRGRQSLLPRAVGVARGGDGHLCQGEFFACPFVGKVFVALRAVVMSRHSARAAGGGHGGARFKRMRGGDGLRLSGAAHRAHARSFALFRAGGAGGHLPAPPAVFARSGDGHLCQGEFFACPFVGKVFVALRAVVMSRHSARAAGGGHGGARFKRMRGGDGLRLSGAAHRAHARSFALFRAGGAGGHLPAPPAVFARSGNCNARHFRSCGGVGKQLSAARALPILYAARVGAGRRNRRVMF